MKNRIELLMPAGDLTRLKASLLYGADAAFALKENLFPPIKTASAP